MRELDIAVVVLENVAARPLEHTGTPAREPRRVLSRADSAAAGLDANQPDGRVGNERVEDPYRIAAAADARDDGIREPAERLEALRPCLLADHGLEFADHQWIRMRTQDRPEQVIAMVHGRDPVAHGLVDRVLERARSGVDAPDGGAEQPHAEDGERLAFHVFRAHVDVALESEERADGGGGDAVLPGPGLGD